MRRASGVIADAVAAVIAARIVTALPELPAEVAAERAAEVAAAAVRDLQDADWYITALPAHLHRPSPETPR